MWLVIEETDRRDEKSWMKLFFYFFQLRLFIPGVCHSCGPCQNTYCSILKTLTLIMEIRLMAIRSSVEVVGHPNNPRLSSLQCQIWSQLRLRLCRDVAVPDIVSISCQAVWRVQLTRHGLSKINFSQGDHSEEGK